MHVTALRLVGRLRWFLLGLVLVVLGIGLIAPLPPHSITIETGPEGGTWYAAALKLKDNLRDHGIKVNIRTNNSSLKIVNDLNDPSSGVDVAFAIQSLDPTRLPMVATLGSTEYQPLFIFYRASFGSLTSPAQLRGKRIILPPEDSATTGVALPLLRAFGVTPTNTTITYHSFAERLGPLISGDADAGLVMLSASSPAIRELALQPDLRIMDVSQAAAIERTFPALHATELPRASYSLEDDIPPADIRLIAATSDIVVRNDLHPAIIYLLLQAMSQQYLGGDLTARRGEFPSPQNRQIPLNKQADEYYHSGVPWEYRALPIWLGSIIGFYVVLIVPIIVILPVYNWLKLPSGEAIFKTVQRQFWLRTLRAIERRLDSGLTLLPQYIRALAVIEFGLKASSPDTACDDVLKRIKTKIEEIGKVTV